MQNLRKNSEKKKKNTKQRHQRLHIKGETDSTEFSPGSFLKKKNKRATKNPEREKSEYKIILKMPSFNNKKYM